MRKQYHLRPSSSGLLAWDVDRLVKLTASHPCREVPLESIRELDEPFWFSEGSETATCRAVADHARLMQLADLRYPIILGADGRVMDGMHRVAKAYLEGRETILAVQREVDPEPDFVGVSEDALPYNDADKREPSSLAGGKPARFISLTAGVKWMRSLANFIVEAELRRGRSAPLNGRSLDRAGQHPAFRRP